MVIYFRNSIFVLLFCFINWTTGIKAMDMEKEHVLPKPHSSIQENEIYNKNLLKQERPTENQATIRFRKKIDRVAKEFKNFEDLESQEQQNLLEKWKKTTIEDWVARACLARHGMMDGQLVVSDETWKKLKRVQGLYPKKERHKEKKYYLFF